RTIARLEHPHIVGIHDVGRTGEGLPYYSMPYLARGHLGQRLADGDPERARTIVRALLSALAYAHARGVIHRDVKAENVLFDEAERPLLADFGIALRRDQGARVTTAGFAVGSTAYMAPEQARGEEVDARVDLYSLGVLTWEMLTGQLPFNAGDALSMAVMHAQDPVPRLPPALRHWQSFIDRALAKAPARRFADAAEMLAALDRVPAGAVRRRVPPADRARGLAAGLRRVPGTAWIAVGLLTAAAIGWSARDEGAPEFFRAQGGQPTGSGLPVPGARPNQAITARPDDALLRAAPASPAERLITAAETQLGAGRWTEPAGDNALESLLAAWQADPAHQRLGATVDTLLDSLGRDAAKRLDAGDGARAKAALAHANRLAAATGRADGPAMGALRARLIKGVGGRVDEAGARFDRSAALAAVDQAREAGLDEASLKALRARARSVPQAGDRVRLGGSEMVLTRSGGAMIAAAARPVTRDEYARFATATGRGESLCRERASLLRIVARRTWQSPGFEQGAAEPVVCVSWQDARAYVDWARRGRSGGVRLPTAAEAAALPRAGGSRAVAVWTNDCSGGCASRMVAGSSWRGAGGTRPLEAARGYDDVGLRLVRDP
ncbi:MAG TPA: bifunctional serine/threonine-protein kinase/formylglycine-generating enzyme family protein, partial [Luteimonas sp.]|nr:bifunctional serine/threonine-protein kinase/formylglycine-generating enzyme family protein [Luteimonas sp.]